MTAAASAVLASIASTVPGFQEPVIDGEFFRQPGRVAALIGGDGCYRLDRSAAHWRNECNAGTKVGA